MTRKAFAPARTLIIVALFIGALTLLVAFTAGQQAGVDQPSGKTPTAFMPHRVASPAQAWQRPATPGTSASSGPPANRLREKNATSATGGSENISFLPAVFYATGSNEATFVAVADVNRDGKPDLLVANSLTNTVAVLLGNGDGTFQSAVSYPSGGSILATIIPVDLKGDGTIDLVVSSQGCCPSEGVISVLMGNGNGTFQPAVTYDSGGLGFANNGLGPAEIAVVDVNGDGKLDIVVVNCASSDSSACGGSNGVISVLLGNGDGTFQTAMSQDMGSPAGPGLVVADVNRDGKPDVVVTAENCQLSTACAVGAVSVMLGNGNGTFQPGVVYATDAWAATDVVTAGLQGNGNLDLIVGGCGSSNCWTNDGTATVLRGNGDGTFQPAVVYDTGARLADGIAVADLNADGNLDVVVANVLGPSVGVLLGTRDDTLQPAVLYSGGNNVYSIAIQDLNGDGKPDIAFATLGGVVGVLINSSTPLGYVSPTSLAFGDQPVNTTSETKLIALSNKGDYQMTVSQFLITGDFQIQANSCLDGVKPSTHCNLWITFAPTLAGAHSGTLTFLDNATNSPQSVSLTGVGTANTTTILTSSHNPSTYGQSVTLTALVIPKFGGGTPTGVVRFYDGAATLGTATLNLGAAALPTSVLPAGAQSLTATYGGDPAYLTSSSTALTQTVKQATSTTLLASSLERSFVGQAVTFTATLMGQFGGAATGAVTFKQGATVLATVPVTGNTAAYTHTFPKAGTFGITAVYAGNSNLRMSTSKLLSQMVQQYSTTTSVTSAPKPSIYGQTVTLTATVRSAAPGGATGTVTFKNGTMVLGTVALTSGKATTSTAKLPVGSDSLTATYNGDASDAKSTSAVLIQPVKQAKIHLTLTSSPNPSVHGKAVKFTATLTSNGGLPTGSTITFISGGTTLGTAKIATTGVTLFSTTALPHGSDVVMAGYSGNASYSSAAASVTQKVN
jgi:Bacterial Ig-like domain (group 3)/FG-GAP-like repeat/Abnormal spindle-like microcephaly-assoc'd, ASPM-SPD-2-Hydin